MLAEPFEVVVPAIVFPEAEVGGACSRTFRSSSARFSSLHGGGAQQYTFTPSCHG